MTRSIEVLLLLAALGTAACASESVQSQGAASQGSVSRGPVSRSPGKQEAPVEVSAVLSPGSARVTFVFQAPASEVDIEFAGLDGLRVTSPARPLAGATFAAGETTALDVTFEAPAGQSNLSVFVTGRFPGPSSSKVANFTVGSPSAAQRQRSLQSGKTGSNGEAIREVPMYRAP